MPRLFFALDFNEVRGTLADIQKHISKICAFRLSKDYHLTLKFLGDIEENSIDDLVQKARQVKHSSFDLSIDKFGAFPCIKDPRVLWVGPSAGYETITLKQKIDAVLSDSFKADKRFIPHITLARSKKRPCLKNAALQMISPKITPLRISSFVLYKSVLSSDGPIYEELTRFTLSPGQGSR